MSNKIFSAEDRAESHQFLEQYLLKNPGSPAECRVNVQPTPAPVLYEVWDGRTEPNVRDPEEDKKAGQVGLLMSLSEKDIEAVAAAVARNMAKEVK